MPDGKKSRKASAGKNVPSPTDEWLKFSPLPPLDGPENIAERLLLLAHYGVDWNTWGSSSSRRSRYWDALTERVKAATFAGPKLEYWWASITTLINSAPRNEEERKEVAALLQCGEDADVLRLFRNAAPVVVLRVRVVAEAKQRAYETKTEDVKRGKSSDAAGGGRKKTAQDKK